MIYLYTYCIIGYYKHCVGKIRWGTWGAYPTTSSDGGDIICHVKPTFFSLDFVFSDVLKIFTFAILCEEPFMLGATHCQVDVETVWCGITDSDIFMNFSFDKMILAFCKFLETLKDF